MLAKSDQKYTCLQTPTRAIPRHLRRPHHDGGGDPFNLFEGKTIAAVATGATRGYIYYAVPSTRRRSRPCRAAIANGVKAGVLGDDILGSGKAFTSKSASGPAPYSAARKPRSWRAWRASAASVRAKPTDPGAQGLSLGKHDAVNNVMTFTAVPYILEHGGQGYARIRHGPLARHTADPARGNIRHGGGLIEYAFGITIRQVIEEFGGGTASGRPVRAVQVGGPLGAYFPRRTPRHAPLDYEAMAAKKGLVGHGGIVVFDDTVDMARQARFAFEFCATESCGKCTPCRIGANPRRRDHGQRSSRASARRPTSSSSRTSARS